MMVGESGYVVNIAIEVYDDDTAYLREYSVVYDEATYLTYIERRADGFYVRLNQDATYTPQNHEYKRTESLCEIVSWLE